jgi:putative ABC transport system permease protein
MMLAVEGRVFFGISLVKLRPRRVPLATRTLFRDWLRLIISVGGIGFAILLVLLLDGIREGTVAKSTTYVDHVGADVFVAREGVTNMALAASVLPEAVVGQVAAVPGIKEAAGILRIPGIVSAGNSKRPVTLIGYESGSTFGGPWQIDKGRLVRAANETVVDEALAGELGLGLGDALDISGASFTVVGLSGQTANIAGKIVFLDQQAMRDLLGIGPIISFVLVKVEGTLDPARLTATLDAQVPGTTATPRADLSRNDRSLLSSLFIAPINVMSTIGFLVGLAIIGLTMYTTTAERLRDFGILKAIGARNWFLVRTVITQAAILGLAGFAVGLGASMLAGVIIVRLVPDIGVSIRLLSALQTLAAVVGMSLVAALLPVVRITQVDPLMVFRS